MIKLNCKICGKEFNTYPSRLSFKKYCSRNCYSIIRNKELSSKGINNRFKKGHIPFSKLHKEIMPKGIKHHNWKGENVSYRGLHNWIRKVKGIPLKCSKCGFKRTTNKSIHWANIDNKYKRNLDDYFALCSSCHKKYDLKSNPVSIFRF